MSKCSQKMENKYCKRHWSKCIHKVHIVEKDAFQCMLNDLCTFQLPKDKNAKRCQDSSTRQYSSYHGCGVGRV